MPVNLLNIVLEEKYIFFVKGLDILLLLLGVMQGSPNLLGDIKLN